MIATVSTIMLFLTGISISRKIIRKGSSSDSSFFPLISMFCSSSLWLKYGLIKGDSTLIFVNSFGAVLMTVYMFIFFIYTLHTTALYRQLFMGLCIVMPSLYMVQTYTDTRETALVYLGSVCMTMGVISYAAPLSSLTEVMRTKSTSCMAFPLCFANFIVSIEWFAYGYVKGDKFIQVPNGLGFICGCIQMLLFIYYPSKPAESTRKSNILNT